MKTPPATPAMNTEISNSTYSDTLDSPPNQHERSNSDVTRNDYSHRRSNHTRHVLHRHRPRPKSRPNPNTTNNPIYGSACVNSAGHCCDSATTAWYCTRHAVS